MARSPGTCCTSETYPKLERSEAKLLCVYVCKWPLRAKSSSVRSVQEETVRNPSKARASANPASRRTRKGRFQPLRVWSKCRSFQRAPLGLYPAHCLFERAHGRGDVNVNVKHDIYRRKRGMNIDLPEFEPKMARQREDGSWTAGIRPHKGRVFHLQQLPSFV